MKIQSSIEQSLNTKIEIHYLQTKLKEINAELD